MATKKKAKQIKRNNRLVEDTYTYRPVLSRRAYATGMDVAVTDTPKVSQVQSALNDMDIELGRLGESLGLLLNCLETVIRVEDAVKDKMGVAPAAVVPLASRILSQQSKVSSYAALVDSLLSRLEL